MRKVLLVLLILVPFIQSAAQTEEEIREQIALEFKQFSAVFPQLDSAQIHVDNAIRLAKLIDDNGLLCQALDYSGYIQSERSNFKEALNLYRQALIFAIESNNENREAVILNHMHISFYYSSNYDSALFYAYESLQKRITLEDTSKIISAYSNLAAVYSNLANFEEAVSLKMKVLELIDLSGDSSNYVNHVANLLSDYANLKRYDLWPFYLDRISKYCKTNCSINDKTLINFYYGRYFHHTKDNIKALLHLDSAILIEGLSKKSLLNSRAYKYKALVNLDQNNEVEFLENMQKCFEIAQNIKNLDELNFVYNHLFRFYFSKSDFQKALEYKLAQEVILDSIKSSKTMWNVNKIHSDMIRKKSQEVIQEREATIAEKEKTNMLLRLSGGLALVIIFGTVLSYQVIRRKNRTIRGQNQELSLYNFELLHDIEDQLEELTSTRKSVDTVISRISHDVRGKVATLKLLSTLTKSDNPSVQDYLSKITLTAKEADDTIAGLTNLARIRSRELEPARINLPQRMLEHFAEASKANESIEFFSDHVLLLLVFDQMVRLMNVYGTTFHLDLENNGLRFKSEFIQLPEDSEWENYLPSPEDFMPHVEFELMQIKVAVNRLTGKIVLRSEQGGNMLSIRIPALDFSQSRKVAK